MLTGCIWEKVVFGKYLFADAFFWEDVVSMGVIFLHLAYVYALLQDVLTPESLMVLALVAYATYFINRNRSPPQCPHRDRVLPG
jgi:3-vinyl bacteriochlorophyllide hydratase